MNRTRLFVDEPLSVGHAVRLEAERAHYLGRVLRLRAGDHVTAFDGSGAEFVARVTTFTRHAAALDVLERTDRDVESPLDIRLVQGVSRGERMDILLQKATELGATTIAPVLTERSVVRLSGDRAGKRRAHWHRIAISACEQCGRNRVPSIENPVSFDDFLATNPDRPLRLVLTPGGAQRFADLDTPSSGIDVIAGPEGGLTDDELHRCQAAGMLSVSMGPRVLRSETAGIAAIAAMQALWGDG